MQSVRRSGTKAISLLVPSTMLVILTMLGCAGSRTQQPTIATGPEAEITADGLHRLDGSGFQLAWVKPDVEFADYKTIMLASPDVTYKRTPRRRSGGSTAAPNYALGDVKMAKFKSELVESLQKEFDRSEFYDVVDTPGADTLLIKPSIIDLVVLVPTEERPASERTFSTSTAVMTLVMELRDAQSGEVLARIAERREARAPGANGTTTLTWSSSVNDAAAIRTMFKRWARILREHLDLVQELAPLGIRPDPKI